jgi:glycosyltransferase involved in cell wall biosynthesis
MMKILLCHNHYQQRGGEDEVFAAETALLQAHGHEVLQFTLHNDSIRGASSLTTAARTLWNRQVYRQLRELMVDARPAVMHCTNTFPLISAAAYYAAQAAGVAVVQSLHNYRMFCLNAYFLRDGQVCEDCLGKTIPWPGVAHGCYRESRAASAVVAGMITLHRALPTWRRTVDRFCALTDFARDKFIQGGLPAERIAVKPNFLQTDPGPGLGSGRYAICVARLSPEKGIDTLLAAWRELAGLLPLKIIGDGPLAEEVRRAAATIPGVEWLGRRELAEVLQLMGDASLLVMPSIWYETFGRTIIEAFAMGTPVIASRIGALAELVSEGETGLLFEPGSGADLAAKVRSFACLDASVVGRMRHAARAEFEHKYTTERNYQLLMKLYGEAVDARRQRSIGKPPPRAAAAL